MPNLWHYWRHLGSDGEKSHAHPHCIEEPTTELMTDLVWWARDGDAPLIGVEEVDDGKTEDQTEGSWECEVGV